MSLLYFVRRYAAKLLYEIEFFQAAEVKSMRARYAEILGDALKLRVNPESYLDDITGAKLEMASVAERIREGLSS